MDNFLASISYPMYLWHILIIAIVNETFEYEKDTIQELTIIVGLTILVSWWSLILVEKPMERIRDRFRGSSI